jgi:putative ABC transport system ATP-binding protein
MAGLEKPTRGTIEINGVKIDKLNERQLTRFRQRHVGFIFQSYNLLPTLNALENVSLPLTFRRVPKKLRDKQAAQMLKAVGLERYVKHRPSQMSGGQQQRVGIARAYVTKAPIIFADEPTGNLDTKTTQDVINLMLKMAKDNNQTMIIVTHDPQIAKYANRVIHLQDGNIIKIEEHQPFKEDTNEI